MVINDYACIGFTLIFLSYIAISIIIIRRLKRKNNKLQREQLMGIE